MKTKRGTEAMLDRFEIIHRGDRKGNNWVVRIRLPSGRSIFGFATENVYGGDWDLGPTWNYAVETEGGPVLIDTGRYGMGGRLLDMIRQAGLSILDFKSVTLTHGHEDHDGGLIEITRRTGIPAWVHPVYLHLSRSYPDQAPDPSKRTFSASCWHCFMPESFTRKHCAEYHRARAGTGIGGPESDPFPFDSGVRVHHLPGHCPDALVFEIDREAVVVGDNLLPEITPHPTQEAFFRWTREILPPQFDRPEKLYGLRAYLRSLRRLQVLGRESPGTIVLPAHRLFYDDRWRIIEQEARSAEIIEHHVQRCGSILAFLKEGARPLEEIVRAHFEPRLLKGFGFRLAEGEIKSHLELLVHCGDVEWNGGSHAAATGTTRFERLIREGAGYEMSRSK